MRTRPRALRATLAVALASSALFLAGAAQASGGHGGLVSTDPRAGARVTIAPLFVRLDFGHDLLDLGAAVQVTGPDGAVVSTGAPRLYPSTVTQALAGDLPAGAYRVDWRVTTDDGRPISGSFRFAADEATEAAAAPAALPGPAAEPAPPASSSGTVGGRAAPVAALAVVAALAAAVVLLARRRRAPLDDDPPDDDPPDDDPPDGDPGGTGGTRYEVSG